MRTHIVLIAAAIACFQLPRTGQTGSPQDATSAGARNVQIQTKASDLLRQVTLDEKIAQLSQLPGQDLSPEFKENVRETIEQIIQRLRAGSVLWISDPKEVNRLQHIAAESIAGSDENPRK
jgi:hypothetical protein